MFQRNIRRKKGISPVISTIILIVVALVIALLVGVFAFGLFTSQTKSLTLQSGNVYAGTSTFIFTLKNPSATPSTVPTVTVSGPGLTASPEACNTFGTGLVLVGAGATVTEECQFAPTAGIVAGNTIDYVVLVNAQSISGSAVSQ